MRAGRLDLLELDRDELPRSMRGLPSEERLAFVHEMMAIRDDLRQRISQLATQRQRLIAERAAVREIEGLMTFDHALRQTLREEAEQNGFRFPD